MQAPAVFVNKDTKVICQGFTGKTGTFHSEQVGHGTQGVMGLHDGVHGQLGFSSQACLAI